MRWALTQYKPGSHLLWKMWHRPRGSASKWQWVSINERSPRWDIQQKVSRVSKVDRDVCQGMLLRGIDPVNIYSPFAWGKSPQLFKDWLQPQGVLIRARKGLVLENKQHTIGNDKDRWRQKSQLTKLRYMIRAGRARVTSQRGRQKLLKSHPGTDWPCQLD